MISGCLCALGNLGFRLRKCLLKICILALKFGNSILLGLNNTVQLGNNSNDYTEIMVLKETTKSWKIALFLPLLTVPQVMLIAWLMNGVTL